MTITNSRSTASASSQGVTAADKLKAKGNEAFKSKDFAGAIRWYSEAIDADRGNHILWANRAAASLQAGAFADATADAKQCVSLCPSFIKGWFRLYTACEKTQDWQAACAAIRGGAKHDTGAKPVFTPKLRRRAAEAAYVARAETAIGAGKAEEAVALAKAGQEIDFRNEALANIMRRATALAESDAAAARAGMSPAERLKQDGNALFKEGQFEAAVLKYTAALERTDDQNSDFAISCYNNRAACYQQVSNFDAVVLDTSKVLEAQPTNPKALLRRALALEGLERLEEALADTRKLLYANSKMDAANRLKNRLQGAIRRAKDVAACDR